MSRIRQLNDIAHEHTIICRQLFAGHMVGSRPMKRKKHLHRMIIGLISKTTTLHVHHTFWTFLCRHYTTKTWKCLLSRFMENVNKRRRNFFSLSKLESGPQEINSKEIRPHSTFSVPIGISATKFEKTRIHFKSDFFAAVAVVDAKAPYLIFGALCHGQMDPGTLPPCYSLWRKLWTSVDDVTSSCPVIARKKTSNGKRKNQALR